MRKWIPLLCLVAVTLGATAVAAAPQGQEGSRVSPPSVEVDGNRLAVGDVIATGIRGQDGFCDFGEVKVYTTPPGNGKGHWLGILLDTQCRVVVNAKWVGSLEDGPRDVTAPLLKALPTLNLPVPEKAEAAPIQLNNGEISTLATKTSEQHIFMIGYGGEWDKLTHKWSELTFDYNGQSATLRTFYDWCYGSKPFDWYEWVTDNCPATSLKYGPSSSIWHEGRGDYHCHPADVFPCNLSNPNGYYHSLHTREIGYANGSSSCGFWWSGNIVYDVRRYIVQGCY